MNAFPRLPLRLTGAVLAAALLAPAAARANELGVGARPTAFVIHDADDTMRNYCHWEGSTLIFALPGGASWELVTSTSDPAIVNPGDGQFHPFDAAEVRSALAGVRYPLQHVAADIFLLPYPRRLGLESAAGPGLILLSPGVRPVSAEQQHAEFTHELGHVVQYALMPDADTTSWNDYRRMRGIADESVYSADAIHADRPHEIFAEDFRALYGDAEANYSGSIENPAIAYPTSVSGLAAFVSALSAAPLAASPLMVVAGAPHGAVMLARNGSGAAPLDLFDVLGRRVASVMPTADASGCHWSWDGRATSGVRVTGTVVFARVRDGLGGVTRVAL